MAATSAPLSKPGSQGSSERYGSESGAEEKAQRATFEYFGWVYHLGVNSIGREYCHLRFLFVRGKYMEMYKRDPHQFPGIVRTYTFNSCHRFLFRFFFFLFVWWGCWGVWADRAGVCWVFGKREKPLSFFLSGMNLLCYCLGLYSRGEVRWRVFFRTTKTK